MANIRSNEVIEVYGGTSGTAADAITSSSVLEGDQRLFDATTNAAQVRTAKFTISNGSNTGTGDVLDLLVLGSDAVVLNFTINGSAALSSGTTLDLIPKIDGTTIGKAAGIEGTEGLNAAFALHTGWGQAEVPATDIGLVTITTANAGLDASKTFSGKVFYYVNK
tara:strand:+ start:130 stop:624 length:495 start_codon:yes stop_codon:yes gene_type:complete